jgi:two-component system CheB/CheR fusion protein
MASEGLHLGALLTLSLPLRPAPQQRAVATPALEGPTRSVLVIEDNVDTAETLRDSLSLDGHEVHVAHDGRSGIALARRVHPQVVICDIGLPELDGYQVAKALKSEGALRGAYLIALSGYAQPEDRQRAADAGFDAHAGKPVDPLRLGQMVAAAGHAAS